MIAEGFFPTLIFAEDVKLDNQQLANDIVAWSKQDKGIKKTNINGWHSQTNMHEMPQFKLLVNELFKMQHQMYKEEWLDRKPKLGNMWANINYPGGYNKPHIHPNSLYSGVYYVKTPPNCGRIIFNDPRPGIQSNMPARVEGQPPKHLWREIHLNTIEGRIIMFPSWLWHCVEENKSNDIRISVSFNFYKMAFNKYQVIKKAISYELANFIFNYFLLKRDAVAWMYQNNITYDTGMLGTWTDQQIPNTYSHYADPVMETLLVKVLPVMQQETGLNLCPTYSYARLYKHGDELKRHKDRPSCEISTTINLGGDPWPIFIDGTGADNVIDEYKNIHKPNAPKGTKVLLEVGDMLVYSGCELEHWREPFEGTTCGQVFLHYNHVNGPFAEKNRFDRRPMLGVPPIRNT